MIGKQDSYPREREKTRHICQQCDLVEELSDEDLKNVAGGALSGIALSGIALSGIAERGIIICYGVQPLYGVAVAREHLIESMNIGIRG